MSILGQLQLLRRYFSYQSRFLPRPISSQLLCSLGLGRTLGDEGRMRVAVEMK